MNTDAIVLNKTPAKPIRQPMERIIHHDQVQIITGMQGSFNISKITTINIVNKLKKINCVISIDVENKCDKVKYPFMVTPSKLKTEVKLFPPDIQNPIANTILKSERPSAFPLRLETGKDVCSDHFYSTSYGWS